jgi:hypothetical protein
VGDKPVAILPYGLAAAAAAPAAAVVSALILGQAKRKILAALIFVCGAFLIDATFGILILSLMEASGEFTDGAGVALVVLLLLALLPYYVPIVMFAIAPRRAAVLLRGFSNWLLEHTRKVEIVTGIVLGGAFLWKGLATLV